MWSLVCAHVCHVRDDMVMSLSLSIVGCGELGRALEIGYVSCSCKFFFMYCECPWDYMDSLFWDVVSGLLIDLALSFVVGACGRYCSWGLWL